jgi:hypothetical protein
MRSLRDESKTRRDNMLDQARDHYRMRRYEEVLKVITNNNNTAAVQ